MIALNVKIAFRNLRRNTVFSVINIAGLAIGLSVCLLIALYVTDELAYDKYNKKADRIFRLDAHIKLNNNTFNAVTVPAPLGPAMMKDYPQIETMTRLLNFNNGTLLIKKGNETIQEHRAVFADSSFFDVFTLPFIVGNPKTALTHPYSLVISETIAKKYFKEAGNALGKTLLVNNKLNYNITGVIKDIPARSHFHFDFLQAMSELDFSHDNNWMGNNFITYVVTREGTNEQTINQYLQQCVVKYLGPQLQQMLHTSLTDLKSGDYFRYTAMPLTKIHLYSNLSFELEANGDIQYVYIFIVVAIFILLLACVNFINLSTAQLAGRTKEVGIRKVLGSLRMQLVLQFLTESVVTTFIALLLALLITVLLLPYFNMLSGKNISIGLIPVQLILPVLGGFIIIVGLLAGSYPAFYLSAFKPVLVLKSKLATGFKMSWLRNLLVVFQFATAIILIIGTIVIYMQLHYMRNKKLGYNRDQVLVLQNTYSLGDHAKTFKDEIAKLPGVEQVTMSKDLPTSTSNDITGFMKAPTLKASDALIMGFWHVDADYIPTMGMTMAKGRNFSPVLHTDSSAVLINETAAKMFGFNDPLNKMIYLDGHGEPVALTIVGVVKDFNAGSLRNKIEPAVFNLTEDRGGFAIRVSTQHLPALISQIKSIYQSLQNSAGPSFSYSFMDDDFNNLYKSEQQTGKLFMSFAALAILIACLGLFGLITYAAEQRVKEIGIRKILGASVNNILQLMGKDFLKLVLLAAIIAFPVAWFSMNKWLQNFAFRTNLSWWIFFAAGALAMLIAVATISFQAIKAAIINPANSLRTE